MEISNPEIVRNRRTEFRILPPETHPNYHLWANYSRFARDRGELVADILESFTPVEDLEILDLGCGNGGAALALSERGAKVTAVDFNPKRIQKLKENVLELHSKIHVLRGNAQNLDFPTGCFDWVILQDVLEHLPEPEKAVQEINRVLKKHGSVYISTPNRWSPLNFISDPHWNLPLVSVFARRSVVFYVTKIVGRENISRQDLAALLSLNKLRHLLEREGLQIQFVHRRIVFELFRRPTAVVNSDFHFSIVNWMRKLRLHKIIPCLVNDKFGFFNYCINPSWYLIGKKI